MNEETRIQREIMVKCSDVAALFRIPAGGFWQGRLIKQNGKKLLVNLRRVKVGVEGYPDLTGWRRSDGRFIAIEVKTGRGRATKEQMHFLEQVRQAGGLAGIARNHEEAKQIILEDKSERSGNNA